jgi:hypothetical protein
MVINEPYNISTFQHYNIFPILQPEMVPSCYKPSVLGTDGACKLS